MKSKFPGYFKLSDAEITELWKNSIFVLDANILLNLYRYSDDTRDNFLKILDGLKDRIWLPNQSASEYFDNRIKVISDQEKSYDKAINALDAIEKDFKSSRQHPFVSEATLNEFSTLSKDICNQLNESKSFHNKRIQHDDVLKKIEKLFENKVGDEFNSITLKEIFIEGKTRYESKTPPGYQDTKKGGDRQYGDLILWKQIIEKSKEENSDIILIIDDKKEDWWVNFEGKTLTPRPELKKEFQEQTDKQKIHMYQSDSFLRYAGDFLKEKVSEKFINEVRSIRELKLRELIELEEKNKQAEIKKIEEIKIIEEINKLERMLISNERAKRIAMEAMKSATYVFPEEIKNQEIKSLKDFDAFEF